MTGKRPALDQRITAELEASGAPWRIYHGKRHVKLEVAGRLAAVLPHGRRERARQNGRNADNALAAVRRAVRAWRENKF